MQEARIAIIGGTGLDSLEELHIETKHIVQTPYGSPSALLQTGTLFDHPVVFLPRHGSEHQLPPHKINYRANIAALAKFNVEKILGITAVGGIAKNASPRSIVLPDQLIDYTYAREHTFYDGVDGCVEHIDFTNPFCPLLRQDLISAAERSSVSITPLGVYGVTQGPRLETAAEIRRMAHDGCTVVGMTAMPEAALAREVGMNYANCSIVVNWAAGIENRQITMQEIVDNLSAAQTNFKALIKSWMSSQSTRPG